MLCRLILKWAVVLHVADLCTMGRKSVMRYAHQMPALRKWTWLENLLRKEPNVRMRIC